VRIVQATPPEEKDSAISAKSSRTLVKTPYVAADRNANATPAELSPTFRPVPADFQRSSSAAETN